MKKIFTIFMICSFIFACSSNEKNTDSNQNNGFNYSKKNSYFKDKKNKNKNNDHHEGCTAPCCAEE
tara:strand:- start:61 stop:258 length:198 start_codon:yes stop_codon:yes gene_type:complete